jgi:hypothetical protein
MNEGAAPMNRKKKVVYCGCSDDWAIVDPDIVPTQEDNGVYIHGFESEQEALDFIPVLEREPPLAWKIVYTDDSEAPFRRTKTE